MVSELKFVFFLAAVQEFLKIPHKNYKLPGKAIHVYRRVFLTIGKFPMSKSCLTAFKLYPLRSPIDSMVQTPLDSPSRTTNPGVRSEIFIWHSRRMPWATNPTVSRTVGSPAQPNSKRNHYLSLKLSIIWIFLTRDAI